MMPAPDWFREWFDSPYYHKLYFERNEKEATAFIDRLIALLQPPTGSRMLDIACGRGRHARILAGYGYETTGIDLAPASIAYAQQFSNDHLDFYVHDMRHILCTNCFEYAFNFFTSFGYFQTQREHDNAIRMVNLALKNDGTFVLDYLNTRYAEDHLVHQSEKIIDGTTYSLTKWSDTTHFYKKIHIEDELLDAPLVFIEKVAKFSLDDFDKMLTRGGMQIMQVYGSYALETYDNRQSPRILMIAKKKKGQTLK